MDLLPGVRAQRLKLAVKAIDKAASERERRRRETRHNRRAGVGFSVSRAQEAVYAEGWFRTITAETFG